MLKLGIVKSERPVNFVEEEQDAKGLLPTGVGGIPGLDDLSGNRRKSIVTFRINSLDTKLYEH